MHEDFNEALGKKTGSGKGKDFLKDMEDALSFGSDAKDKLDRLTSVALPFIDKDKEVKKAMNKVELSDVKFRSDADPEKVMPKLKKILKGKSDKEKKKDDDSDSASGSDRDGEDLDARVLSVIRTSQFGRRRNFVNTVESLREDKFSRTLLWLLQFITQHYLSPTARHARFCSERKLKKIR